MNYYEPQVQLLKRTHMDGPDEYFLHAITNTERSSSIAMGHSPIPTQLNGDGALEINLIFVSDMERVDLNILTPVVHTLRIGPLPTDETDIPIVVNIMEGARSGDEPKGSVTVLSINAAEVERPLV